MTIAPAVGVGGAGAAPPAAQPAAKNPTQVPTVTSYQATTYVNGVAKQVPIVYTQLFSSIPSQGPTPMPGTIGLGTLTGSVGVVRTSEAKKGDANQNLRGGVGFLVLSTVSFFIGTMIMWV